MSDSKTHTVFVSKTTYFYKLVLSCSSLILLSVFSEDRFLILYQLSLFKRTYLEFTIGLSINKKFIRENVRISLGLFIKTHFFSKDKEMLPVTFNFFSTPKCIFSDSWVVLEQATCLILIKVDTHWIWSIGTAWAISISLSSHLRPIWLLQVKTDSHSS